MHAIPLSIGELENLQVEAGKYLETLGIAYMNLTVEELQKFAVSFTRQFVLAFPHREVVDLHVRHLMEIQMGAMVAKEQMDASFDGETPGSNRIGMVHPRAIFLGIGDDWEDVYGIYSDGQYNWTTGSSQNWIHSGTTVMGGTDGNPIRIGKNQVTVLIAYRDIHSSPKGEVVYYELDGKPKSCMVLSSPTKLSELGIKELDNAIFLYQDKELLCQLFIPDFWGATELTWPSFLGASFIKEPQLRVELPSSIPGTTRNVVISTG